ncbi:alkane 1-monooxygenase [Mycobacterium sp. MYCO198283]|nr:alkane 1-monooxygenase [Mycobacterium sp. MYCO198283]MCG5431615.1 alkane 1-monooxygenase [Mycobacterium sp. MYCO198283]
MLQVPSATRSVGTPWYDRKRHLWLMGLIAPTMPILLAPVYFVGAALGHPGVLGWLCWTGPFLMHVVIPLLDWRVGVDGRNPPEDVIAELEDDPHYRWCIYAYIPFQYVTVVVSAYLFTAADLAWIGHPGPLGWPAKLGLAISVGILGGLAINTAHELGHKREDLERRLARITLAQTFYGHFYVEHNRGHHVRVATPEDPASARFGESLWAFWLRSIVGGVRSSWRLEAARLRRDGVPVLSRHNDVLTCWLMSVIFWAVLVAAFGPGLLPLVLIQAWCGVTLLEAVNYTEHYGLLRRRLPSGRYERCAPEHSWNSDHLVTNLLLYHLQRHSDHHANPMRRYQTLRTFDEAPNLPSGYAAMVTLAYLPPLWRKVMDHRVLAHYDGDITRVNIDPRKRAAVLARHGRRAEPAR